MAVAAEPRAPLLGAARGVPTAHTPVWFMRQAGRYLPEYRAIRERLTLLEICARPEVAAEVTLQPVRRFSVDAAILFADILLPLNAMGLGLSFAAGEGPVLEHPIRSLEQAEALPQVDVHDSLATVFETIKLVCKELPGHVPLIGFAGAPFTLASYAIEGGASRSFLETKRLMYTDERAWVALMDRLASVTTAYLRAQADAGARALQLFDSWAGALSPTDYARFVMPWSSRVLSDISATGVPVIHFGVGTATLLELMSKAGGDVIGLDWRTPLGDGWRRAGTAAIQGNLDPVALFASRDELERKVHEVLDEAGGRPGHIFNLGHGILPTTPPDAIAAVVDLVHESTS